MKICFFNISGPVSPVEEYFYKKFGDGLDEPDKESAETEIANIFAKWKHVADNDGKTDGQYAKKMSGYDFIEIRIKRGKTLIRFPYYRDATHGRLVLLNGFEKIDGYKTGGAMDRFIERKFKEAQKYYEQYNRNNELYKEMPDIFEELYSQLNF